jgi:multiple sugar transport system permease protein
MSWSRGSVVRLSLLVAFGIVMVFPFWYMVVVSLEPNTASLRYPPQLWPASASLANYTGAWNTGGFAGDFFRSAYISASSTLIGTAAACLFAFVIARYHFAGRRILFYTLVGSMMIPTMTFLLPQFDLLKTLHLLNSIPGLILIYAAGSVPFTVFMMKGFFEEIPVELEDAVSIDGGGRWTMFARVALPLAAPALAAVLLFNFMGGWDEFIQALTFLDDPGKFTMPIALQLFQNQHSTQWGEFFAAAVFQTLPLVVLFMIFQRRIIGVMGGAVKG